MVAKLSVPNKKLKEDHQLKPKFHLGDYSKQQESWPNIHSWLIYGRFQFGQSLGAGENPSQQVTLEPGGTHNKIHKNETTLGI